MAGDRFINDACQASSHPHGFLQAALVQVMAAFQADTWVDGQTFGRVHILPAPLSIGTGVLDFQCIGQFNTSQPFSEVSFM
jgi:hypothetical protein